MKPIRTETCPDLEAVNDRSDEAALLCAHYHLIAPDHVMRDHVELTVLQHLCNINGHRGLYLAIPCQLNTMPVPYFILSQLNFIPSIYFFLSLK